MKKVTSSIMFKLMYFSGRYSLYFGMHGNTLCAHFFTYDISSHRIFKNPVFKSFDLMNLIIFDAF